MSAACWRVQLGRFGRCSGWLVVNGLFLRAFRRDGPEWMSNRCSPTGGTEIEVTCEVTLPRYQQASVATYQQLIKTVNLEGENLLLVKIVLQ